MLNTLSEGVVLAQRYLVLELYESSHWYEEVYIFKNDHIVEIVMLRKIISGDVNFCVWFIINIFGIFLYY